MSGAIDPVSELRRLAEQAAGSPDGWMQLGMQCFNGRRFADAADAFLKALRLNPGDASLWSNYSATMNELGRVEDSIGAAREAIRLNPEMIEAWNNLGAVLDRSGRPLEAVTIYEQALRIRPSSDIWSNLGNANKAAGKAEVAVECYRQAVALRPDNWRAWSNMLFVMNYSASFSLPELAAEHARFGRAVCPADTCKKNPPTPLREKLRIGFVSADLYNHPVGRLFLPVIEAPRSGRLEWFLYVNNTLRDKLTERLCAAADAVRWITGASDEVFARQVADDQIDILIDLAGHTAGNRLTAFARRLAPVQATWLGYAFTTGLPEMDFVIADRVVLPIEDRAYYAETPAYLPNFYFLAGAPDTALKAVPPPLPRHGYPTFGSFNNPAKISPRVFALWAKLLGVVPEARLLFKNKAFAEPSFCRHVTDIFVSHGVAASRLSFEGQSWGDAYFESFSRVDVALDPFPFPGLMTTLDTLWMGVPVVMLQERAGMLGRHGARLLELIGHPDWVASDEAGYLEKARALVADANRLAELRAGLRPALQASPVMDAPGFVAALENLLIEMAATRGIALAAESQVTK